MFMSALLLYPFGESHNRFYSLIFFSFYFRKGPQTSVTPTAAKKRNEEQNRDEIKRHKVKCMQQSNWIRLFNISESAEIRIPN